MLDEVDWSLLDKERVFEAFREIFNNRKNVRNEAYFDKMTHFDFKCLLPALLHVEDRMSMAHGLESRVPLLDHPLVEFAATAPADVKFEAGNTKHLLKRALGHELPETILNRRDKMGFPVPLKEWFGRRAARIRAGFIPIASGPNPSVLQRQGGPVEFRQGRAVFAKDLGSDVPWNLASVVPRPGGRNPLATVSSRRGM